MSTPKTESILEVVGRAVNSPYPLQYNDEAYRFDLDYIMTDAECQQELLLQIALSLAVDGEEKEAQWLDANTQARMLDLLIDHQQQPSDRWQLFQNLVTT